MLLSSTTHFLQTVTLPLYLLPLWLFPLLLVLTPLSIHLSRTLLCHLIYTNKLRSLNCHPPPHFHHRWDPFFGSDIYRENTRARAAGSLMRMLQDRYRKYGKTFQATNILGGGGSVLYTADSRNIQAICTAPLFDNFQVGPLRRPANGAWVGEGVFISDGEVWRHARRVVMPVFGRAGALGGLEGFGRLVGRMMALLPGEGETVDLRPLLRRLFLDSSTEFLFGESSNTLLPNESARVHAEEFLAAFDKAMVGVDRRMALAGIPFLYGRATRDAEWKQAIATVHDFVDKHINRELTEQARKESSSSHDKDPDGSVNSGDAEPKDRPFNVLSELIRETHDRKFLRDQLISLFFPSRDATGIGLSGLFFNLARNPRVWTKVREETFSPEHANQPLTFETLKSMKYLQCVLNETLRLLSPASMGARICTTSTILPYGGGPHGDSPILVQAGTKVDMNFGVMQRDVEFWGNDAEEFRPERWEEGGVRPRWEYIPFLGGGRICPAQQMVLTHMGYVMATFARRFATIENRDPEERFVEEYMFSVQSRNGVLVAFGAGEGREDF